MPAQLILYDPTDALLPGYRKALRGQWTLAVIRTRRALRLSAPNADFVVVTAADKTISWQPVLQDLAVCAPAVPRLIIASLGYQPRRALLDAARLGTRLFIAPSASALHDHLFEVLARDNWSLEAAATLDRELARLPSIPLRALLAEAAAHHIEGMRVPEFARLLGCSARTLARRCMTAGAPVPRVLLEWGRVLRRATLEEVCHPMQPRRAPKDSRLGRRSGANLVDIGIAPTLASVVETTLATCCVRALQHPTASGSPRLSVIRGERRSAKWSRPL